MVIKLREQRGRDEKKINNSSTTGFVKQKGLVKGNQLPKKTGL